MLELCGLQLVTFSFFCPFTFKRLSLMPELQFFPFNETQDSRHFKQKHRMLNDIVSMSQLCYCGVSYHNLCRYGVFKKNFLSAIHCITHRHGCILYQTIGEYFKRNGAARTVKSRQGSLLFHHNGLCGIKTFNKCFLTSGDRGMN